MIDHFEPIFSGRDIDSCNVNDVCELSIVMILQEITHWKNPRRMNQHLQLIVMRQLDLLYIFR